MSTAKAITYQTSLRDFVALAKPNVTFLVIITAAGGVWLAPGHISFVQMVAAVLGTVMVVTAANALNCYIERESDKHMARTKSRPLPAGRMAPVAALWFGIVLAVTSIPILTFMVNPITGFLAFSALVMYVWIYTPMKQISPQALMVGAVPGAMPPLMGWTAVTGRIELPGLVLFGILFVWQLPHFVAITIYRRQEYDRAGIKTLMGMHGEGMAKAYIIFWTLMLLPMSLLLGPLDFAGPLYLGLATLLGVIFIVWAFKGLSAKNMGRWARNFFLYSLVYLTVLMIGIAIDAGPVAPG